MGEGKYVEEVYKQVCKLPDDDPHALADLMRIANTVAEMHPVWYERFRIGAQLRKAWRWAIR